MPATEATVVEPDNENLGKDPEYPVALRVEHGKGTPEEFFFMYRLVIKGDGLTRELKVKGVCDVVQFHSPPLDDSEIPAYVASGFRRSIPGVREYLERKFPGITITGSIRGPYDHPGIEL